MAEQSMDMHIGIDVGSVATKGVLMREGAIVCRHVVPSGFNYGAAADRMREELLAMAGASADDVSGCVTTGCGAANAGFPARQASEIVCCARGMQAVYPSAKTVICVGGQSTQVIRAGDNGTVADFVVSERCAAGSARFLQVMANVLRVNLEDIGELSLKATNPVTFSTGCAVFGETEAITRIAEGWSKEDILAGVHRSLTGKIASLVARVELVEDCTVCGGGALDVGLIRTLEDTLGRQLLVPSHPQVVTALGAAVLAQAAPQS